MSLSERKARQLAARIRAYWLARGKDVDVIVTQGDAGWVVRSTIRVSGEAQSRSNA